MRQSSTRSPGRTADPGPAKSLRPGVLISGGALGGTPVTLAADGFHVTTTLLAPHTQLPLHAHERANLNLVLAETYEERVGTRRWLVPRGSCIVKPAGASHANRIGPSAVRCVVIELEPSRVVATREYTPLLDDVRLLRSATFAALGHRILREVRSPDLVTPLALSGVIFECIAAAARRMRGVNGPESRPRPPWLDHVIDLLHAASRGSAMPSMATLGLAAGRHPVYVARVFRHHYRMSIGEFVRAQRHTQAVRAIRETDRPLSQIALELGYADQSHLSRSFLSRTGLPPSQFRRTARSAPSET